MRPGFDEIYLRFAMDLARRSTCERLQVGCVIVTSDYRQVVGIGYNGGPAKGRNDCKRDASGLVVPGACGHLHAESNAIIGCSYAGPMPVRVFITDLPCEMCAIALVNMHAARAPIMHVIYGRDYRDRAGVHVLQHAGIPCTKYDGDLFT